MPFLAKSLMPWIIASQTIPILAIGTYPNPLLRRVEPAVLEILHQMGRG